MSRQAEWSKKQVALGNCRICGKPRNVDSKGEEIPAHQVSKEFCHKHLRKIRLKKRKAQGLKAWRPTKQLKGLMVPMEKRDSA